MTHLYMIRHGDYVGLTSEPFDGGLSAKGIQQATLLRDRLLREGFKADVLMARTLPRAMHTAEILAPALQLTPQFEPRFKALTFGPSVSSPLPSEQRDAKNRRKLERVYFPACACSLQFPAMKP